MIDDTSSDHTSRKADYMSSEFEQIQKYLRGDELAEKWFRRKVDKVMANIKARDELDEFEKRLLFGLLNKNERKIE